MQTAPNKSGVRCAWFRAMMPIRSFCVHPSFDKFCAQRIVLMRTSAFVNASPVSPSICPSNEESIERRKKSHYSRCNQFNRKSLSIYYLYLPASHDPIRNLVVSTKFRRNFGFGRCWAHFWLQTKLYSLRRNSYSFSVECNQVTVSAIKIKLSVDALSQACFVQFICFESKRNSTID